MKITTDEQQQFVNYLLQISEGKEATHSYIGEDIIRLDDDMVFNEETIDLLVSNIFDNIDNNYLNNDNYVDYIKNRAILILKNDDVDDINEKIINIFPG